MSKKYANSLSRKVQIQGTDFRSSVIFKLMLFGKQKIPDIHVPITVTTEIKFIKCEDNGYGLTGVREVVEKYNGTIEIKPDNTILLSCLFFELTGYELCVLGNNLLNLCFTIRVRFIYSSRTTPLKIRHYFCIIFLVQIKDKSFRNRNDDVIKKQLKSTGLTDETMFAE